MPCQATILSRSNSANCPARLIGTTEPAPTSFRPAPSNGFRIKQNDEGAYVVEGDGVEKLVARYDLDNEDALQHLELRLRGLGVIRALEAAGFEPGDDVEIAGVVFELDP